MMANREIDYDKLLENINDMINILEYDSSRSGGKAKKISDLCIIIPGTSKFPGQVGKNDNNFHIEDIQNSISHVLVGLLKEYVQNK